jgi:putative SOS response-associated peptidase YedK
MCGRYLLTTPSEALARLFSFIERPNLPPRYNIAPTQDAPVVRQRRDPPGERSLQTLRWGLVPPWSEGPKFGSPLINARAESLAEKASFRTAFRRRRCLVPADGFYEWRGAGADKEPYLITRSDGAPFAFAGLWERWTPPERAAGSPPAVDSFAIITTEANDFLRPLHARMPVILPQESYARWLDPDAEPADLAPLLAPAPNALLRYVPIGRAVNSVRNDGSELIAPTGPEMRWS